MKLFRLVCSVLLSLGVTACGADRVDSADARRLVSDERATLLDVRTPGEFASGHVEGAVNVPVDEVATRLSEIPRDAPVVVYCRSGARSARAASALHEAGYEVHDVGPMPAW